MEWMYWTSYTTYFLIVLAAALAIMTVKDVVSPGSARRGFLPIATTGGDRLFVSILVIFGVYILWLAFVPALSHWYATVVALVLAVITGRYG